jgi:hypothetical protein
MVFHLVPTPTTTPEPSATPVIPSVHVRSYRMSRSPSASAQALIVVGEIENGTNQPVFLTRVSGKFYDGFGTLIATQDTYALFNRTDPGQRNPFRMLLLNPPSSIVSMTFTLTPNSSSSLTYVPATVVSQQTRDNVGVEVFGEVRNDQAKDAKNILVAATFYDSVGGVFDVVWSDANISPLAPGALSTYKISTFNTNLNDMSYTVQAQGYLSP